MPGLVLLSLSELPDNEKSGNKNAKIKTTREPALERTCTERETSNSNNQTYTKNIGNYTGTSR